MSRFKGKKLITLLTLSLVLLTPSGILANRNNEALLTESVTSVENINPYDYWQYLSITNKLEEFSPSYTVNVQTKNISKNIDDFLSVVKNTSAGTNYIKKLDASKVGDKLTIKPTYRGNKTNKDQAQKYVDGLIKSLPANWKLEDKIAYIAISISHLPYHWNINETINPNGYSTQIASSLINGGGQCSAYSEMFNMAMNRLGVENRIVYGIAKTGDVGEFPHAWSMIKLNGQWYHVDPTFIRCQLLLKGIGWLESKPVIINWNYFMFTDDYALKNGRKWNREFYPKSTTKQYLVEGKTPAQRYKRKFKSIFSEDASIKSVKEGKYPKIVNDNFFK